eukprot:512476_1
MKKTMCILAIIAIHLLSHCHCIGPATIPTVLHGGIGGKAGSSWATYPVNAILSWVECNTTYFQDAVTGLSFSHSDGTQSPKIGRNPGASCAVATLDTDEYINAYKIWTATPPGKCVTYTIYVFGFAFRTNKGRELQCGGPNGGCSEHETTGWVTYDGYFMGGVNWRGGTILDAIGFCFIREDLMGAVGLSCDHPPNCAEQGLSFNEPRTCQCKTTCGGCTSLEAVATSVQEELIDYEVCANLAESCCCGCNSTSAPTAPTFIPSKSPTSFTSQPTQFPVVAPSKSPSKSPSRSPTKPPSISPSKLPTKSPSNSPIKSPTKPPSKSPSKSPTKSPSKSPNKFPTKSPSNSPIKSPSISPSNQPTEAPTNGPTKEPTQILLTEIANTDGDETKARATGGDTTIVFVIVGVLVLFLVLFIAVYCVRKQKQRESVPDHDDDDYDGYDDGL